MLEVKNLCKSYGTFGIKDVSFTVKRGFITGFIGANGAGKTTTLKSMLNIVRPDSGSVTAFGLDMRERETEIKSRLSFCSGAFDFYLYERAGKVASVYKRFYDKWNDKAYHEYLKKFHLDENKKIKDFSAGMKVKFSLALGLSHEAELLILDEPTSGLDPVARDELLELFGRLIEDGEKSVLFSTHITSDLDKCADYILFIKDGLIVGDDTRDGLIDSHVLVSGGADELTDAIEKNAVGIKKNKFSFTAMMKRDCGLDLGGLNTERPNLEDIMVYYNRDKESEL